MLRGVKYVGFSISMRRRKAGQYFASRADLHCNQTHRAGRQRAKTPPTNEKKNSDGERFSPLHLPSRTQESTGATR